MAPGPVQGLMVGVDIAAASFTAVMLDERASFSKPHIYPQTAEGFTAFQRQLQQTEIAPELVHIVMEATGSYWVALAVVLYAANYRVSVVNPAQVHFFAKAELRRAKTDPLDAQLLARFAAEKRPPLWSPPPSVYHELRQRLAARDVLIESRKQLGNHRHALIQWPVLVEAARTHLDQAIAGIDEQITALEQEIKEILANGSWAPSALLLQGITGIGMITAAWLLVATVNFTLCPTTAAATAYVGLAPVPRESGTSVRRRRSIGHAGHGRVRAALYMASLSAARYNPVIKPFYDRLRAMGKPAKVARCAAARKLLHVAWAVVTKQQAFDPNYGQRDQRMERAEAVHTLG